MIIAKVAVSGVRAQAVEYISVPAGIVGAEVMFEFTDSVWDDLIRTAVFRGCCTRSVLLHGNTAIVPADVVARKGPRLEIGVCGVDVNSLVVIPTLWAVAGHIKDAAPTDPTGDPAMPVWADLQQQINDLKESGVGGGVSEERVQELVNESLQEAKESGEFDGEDGADGAPGKSAYEYAQEGGYTGTEEEFAEKLAQDIPEGVPPVTEENNGQFLRVVDGAWSAVSLTDVSEVGA